MYLQTALAKLNGDEYYGQKWESYKSHAISFKATHNNENLFKTWINLRLNLIG